jgi:hypothetical protein
VRRCALRFLRATATTTCDLERCRLSSFFQQQQRGINERQMKLDWRPRWMLENPDMRTYNACFAGDAHAAARRSAVCPPPNPTLHDPLLEFKTIPIFRPLELHLVFLFNTFISVASICLQCFLIHVILLRLPPFDSLVLRILHLGSRFYRLDLGKWDLIIFQGLAASCVPNTLDPWIVLVSSLHRICSLAFSAPLIVICSLSVYFFIIINRIASSIIDMRRTRPVDSTKAPITNSRVLRIARLVGWWLLRLGCSVST